MKISEMCSWCDKRAVLTCPDCGWEACGEHSREDGKCFYCTKIGVEIDQDAVDLIRKLGEALEYEGKESREMMKKAHEEYREVKY